MLVFCTVSFAGTTNVGFLHSLYERVFAHRNRRVRYRGLKKVEFQVGIRVLTFNLKRVMTLVGC